MHYDCDETHLRGKKETLLSLLFSSKFIFAEFLIDIYLKKKKSHLEVVIEAKKIDTFDITIASSLTSIEIEGRWFWKYAINWNINYYWLSKIMNFDF